MAGEFDVDLPLSGLPGIECRSGGPTSDYLIIVAFDGDVAVEGSPQAEVTSGTGMIGSGGVGNGGMVTVSGNTVTVPLTNVANAQTITVTLNGVATASSDGSVTIPMSILVADTNANGAVNSADLVQTKARLGQTLDSGNFRSDVNVSGSLNAGDVLIIKASIGTGLPDDKPGGGPTQESGLPGRLGHSAYHPNKMPTQRTRSLRFSKPGSPIRLQDRRR